MVLDDRGTTELDPDEDACSSSGLEAWKEVLFKLSLDCILRGETMGCESLFDILDYRWEYVSEI